MLSRLASRLRNEPVIVRAVLSLAAVTAGVVVDFLEVEAPSLAAIVAIVLGQAGFARRKVTPVQ